MAKSLFLVPLLTLAACAPSPLHVSDIRIGTGGEIPRDGRGEPIWSAIHPSPPEALRHVPLPVLPPAGRPAAVRGG